MHFHPVFNTPKTRTVTRSLRTRILRFNCEKKQTLTKGGRRSHHPLNTPLHVPVEFTSYGSNALFLALFSTTVCSQNLNRTRRLRPPCITEDVVVSSCSVCVCTWEFARLMC